MVADDIDEEIQHLLYDPQTSGGLLLSLSETDAARVGNVGYRVGRVLPKGEGLILVK